MANGVLNEGGSISMRERIARGLGGFAAGMQGNSAGYLQGLRNEDKALSAERKRAAAEDIASVNRMMKSGDVDGAMGFWENRLQNLDRLGAKDQTHSLQLYEMIQSGDVGGAIAETDEAIRTAQQRGFLPKSAVPEVRIQDGVVYKISPEGEVTHSSIDGYINPELQKETRGLLRTGLKELDAEARSLQSNYSKIQNLASQAEGGHRQAVAATIIALVKLGEPNSTVREGEMIASLNTANPVAAAAAVLAGNGVGADITDSVLAAVDPLSPNLIQEDKIMQVASGLLGGVIPTMREQYDSYKEQAVPIKLSQAFMDSTFTPGRQKVYDRLGRFIRTEFGTEENGYRYIGGDDEDKKNWVKL